MDSRPGPPRGIVNNRGASTQCPFVDWVLQRRPAVVIHDQRRSTGAAGHRPGRSMTRETANSSAEPHEVRILLLPVMPANDLYSILPR